MQPCPAAAEQNSTLWFSALSPVTGWLPVAQRNRGKSGTGKISFDISRREKNGI